MENSRLIVFDVDGTLLPDTSCERLFVRHLVRSGVVGPGSIVGFARSAMALLPRGLSWALKANKGYLRGLPAREIEAIARDHFGREVALRISKKGAQRVRDHRQSGERVMLLSGMPEFLLRNFCEYLDVDEAVGSVMELRNGRFTGRTVGPFPLAEGKVDALRPILENSHVGWEGVTAYADHGLDRYLLAKVGHPVVVNAREDLRRLAAQRGWPTETFD